jgi:uncharacterized protein
MRVIVDGYNLIRNSPYLSRIESQDLEAGRRELLRRLSEYQRRRGHRVQVVFDAAESPYPSRRQERIGGVSVTFSRRGETADEVIKGLASAGREGVVVITSDRDLAAFAERQGSSAISVEEFERKIMSFPGFPEKDTEEQEEPDRPPGKKKGTARRLPKAERRRQVRLNLL